jgi:N-acyl-D-aspartate/D-glutamate deacylase
MLLISNALAFDGSGSDPVESSVSIDGTRIAQVGPAVSSSAGEADEVIDGRGLAVAPGFIDLHSHSDLQVLQGRTEKLKQGVTLEVVGNCGFSPYPYSGDGIALREFGGGILNGVNDWGWPDAASYLQAMAASGAKDRALSLAGHGSLRIAVRGPEQGTPTSAELDRMADLLDDSLGAGCAGFSTGLMYAPGSSATPDELRRLCSVVARRGKLYATHMRSYSATLVEAVQEQIDLAERTGCRLQISHLQTAGRANWHLQQRALDEIEAARQRGIDIEFDIYPYQCGSTVLTQLLPQWALDGGTVALLNRLRDSAARKAILDEMNASNRYWEDVTISSLATEANERFVGKTVTEIAALRGEDPAMLALNLLLEEHAAVNIVSFNQSEENLRQLITHPLCSVITDGFYVKGKAHPRLYGTYPQLLGALVREQRWLSMAQAIHKSTAKPAARLNLPDRGLLRPGYMADLVVFDPERIASRSTYDSPAADPQGIRYVIKNGEIVFRGAAA